MSGPSFVIATVCSQWAAQEPSLVTIVHGSPEACREHIQRYIANGVTTPALAILPFPGVDPRQALRDLAPQ